MNLVAAICGVQSEQFLDRVLSSLFQTDIDAVHYMDGSWDNSGMNLRESTDKTHEILAEFRGNTPIEVVYESAVNPTYGSWKSQSHKRNTQLSQIERIYGKDTWVLVIDDDENLIPQEDTWSRQFKTFLKNRTFGLGTIDSIAPPPGKQLAKLQVMKTARFFHMGFGLHYHTETNMLVHDIACNVVCDYHNDRDGFVDHNVFDTPAVKIENFWMHRSDERILQKNQYYNYLTESNKSIGDCKFE